MTLLGSAGRPDLSGPRPNPRFCRRDLAIYATIVVVSWPFGIARPVKGYDGSWGYALQRTFLQGLRAGTDYVFTYGPLGFLTIRAAWSWPLAVVAAAYATAAVAAVVLVVYCTWRARAGAIAAAMAAGAMALAASRQDPAELVLVAMAAAGYWSIDATPSTKAAFWLPVALSVVATMHLLVKFDVGLAGGLVAAASLLFAEGRSIRRALTAAMASVATFLVLWSASGQRMVDLPRWVRGSVSLATGYSSAMSYGSPSGPLVLRAIVGGVLVIVLMAAVIRYGARRLPLAALTAVLVVLAVKHAFIRPDDGHLPILFILIATVLPLALTAVPGRRGSAIGALSVFAALVVVFSYGIRTLDRSLPSVSSTIRSLDPSTRRQWLRADRQRILRSLHITPDVEMLLQGHTVHVEPYEVSALWAMPGVRWKPVPGMQSYSAYTPYLDRRNLDSIRSEEAPEFVLRLRQAAVDHRNPVWESPAYQVGLQCRYRPVMSRDAVEVLERVPWRCTSPAPLTQVDVKQGEVIQQPQVADDEFLVMHIDASPGPVERLATIGLRSFRYTTGQVDGARRFRLVDATMSGPLLVRTPPGASGYLGRPIGYQTLSLSRDATIRYEVFKLST